MTFEPKQEMADAMMIDMDPGRLGGPGVEFLHNYFDGTTRVLYTTGVETVVGDEQLIVSRSDRRGIITDVNQALVAVSGYDARELVGQPQAILRHPDTPTSVFGEMWDAINDGRQWRGIFVNLRRDGGFYRVHATVLPNIKRGRIVGYTSVQHAASRASMFTPDRALA